MRNYLKSWNNSWLTGVRGALGAHSCFLTTSNYKNDETPIQCIWYGPFPKLRRGREGQAYNSFLSIQTNCFATNLGTEWLFPHLDHFYKEASIFIAFASDFFSWMHFFEWFENICFWCICKHLKIRVGKRQLIWTAQKLNFMQSGIWIAI